MHVHNIIFQRGVTFPALFLALADNNTMVRYDIPIMDLTRILYIRILYIIRILLKEIDGFLREISLKIAKFS